MKKSNRGQQEFQCLQKIMQFIPNSHPIRLYLDSAKPNKHLSEFPDFIFEQGFIEHFQVTSAKESSKGDNNRISEVNFQKECQEKFDLDKKEFLNSRPCHGTVSTEILEMNCPEYSYKFFIDSFKRNFEKHIHSLDKYNGNKSIGILLVEHTGARITVLKNRAFCKFYKIEYDKMLLTYLYSFADKLKYLICFWGDTQGDLTGKMSCEIIEIRKIPELINKVPKDISFSVGQYKNLKLNIFLDL